MTYLRVRELAEEQGLNIFHLSRKSGLAYTTVHSMWHGKAMQLNLKTLDTIAATLGVRVSDLFAGEPEVKKEGNSLPFTLPAFAALT